MNNDYLKSEVRHKLQSLRQSLRRRLVNEGLAWMLVALVATVFATLAFDYVFRTDRLLRGLVMAVSLGAVGLVVWRSLVSPLRVPMDPSALALLLEKHYPTLDDRLVSVVQFSQRPPEQAENASPAMLSRLAAETNQLAGELDFSAVVERRRLRQLGMIAACALGLLIGFTVWQQPVMAMWFQRNVAFADVDWPQDTVLVVQGGPDFTVIRGDDFDVTVEAVGKVPPFILLNVEYASGEKLQVKVEAQASEGVRFSKKIPAVDEPFTFYATGGDDRRDGRRKHRVTVVPPPAMRDIRFRVEHMEYMKRPASSSEGGRDIFVATPGSTIFIDGNASKDIQSATLYVDDKKVQDMTVTGQRQLKGSFPVSSENVALSRSFKMVLTATDSSTNRRERPYMVQIQPDLPPDVEMKKHSVGAVVTPNAYIPLVVQLKDDYGIAVANVMMSRKDTPAVKEELTDLPSSRDFRVEHTLDLEKYSLKVGESIEIVASARDNMPSQLTAPATAKEPNGTCGPNGSRSGVIELRIIKPEDMKEEMIRRQKELRVEFSEAVEVEKTARTRTASAVEAAQGGDLATARNLLAESGRLQTSVGTECAKAADTMAAIVAEMRCNRVSLPRELDQMTDELTKPLAELGKPIQETIGLLGQAGALGDAAAIQQRGDAIAAAQAQIHATMEEILRKMIEKTSRQEAEKELLKLIERSNMTLEEILKIKRATDSRLFDPTPGAKTKPAGPAAENK